MPVTKVRLPRDPVGHVQRLNLLQTPDGTLIAAQHSLWHRSVDGGRTWTDLPRPAPTGSWRLQIAPDGSLINITLREGDSPTVWGSQDEGETWRQVGAIDVDAGGAHLDLGFSVTRLPDGGLLVPVVVVEPAARDDAVSGARVGRLYRSDDGGVTWSRCGDLGAWCHEANITVLPEGRLLAVVRYQRPRLADDPPDLGERTGGGDSAWPYKHVFVTHSGDAGATWSPVQQLCTVYGQCYGAAGVLADNTVTVVHDHRYPRSLGSGRAVLSRDGGDSWQDEVYYLVHGDAAGYAATVSPDGESFLTLAGSCYGDVDSGWDFATGRTDFVLIRWRPVD